MSQGFSGVDRSPAGSTGKRHAGARAIVGLVSFMGGAALVSSFVIGHPGATCHNGWSNGKAPAAEASTVKASTAADAQFNIDYLRAQRYLKPDVSSLEGRSFEYAVFQESDHKVGPASEIKRVVVESKCGYVIVLHTPGTRVLVLAGKYAIAPEKARAREYASKLNYTIKQEGDRIQASISQPKDMPDDVYDAAVECIVVAPVDVRVVTRSGTF